MGARIYDALGALKLADQHYAMRLPEHLADVPDPDRLRDLLARFDFLQAKVVLEGPEALARDFDLVDDAELRIVQSALRLAAPALQEDAPQLPTQLIGRLMSLGLSGLGGRLLQKARDADLASWLRPVRASLTAPGQTLARVLRGHSYQVNAVAVMRDGRRAVSASSDHTLGVWDLESGVRLHELRGHTEPVYALALVPDVVRAVSASEDLTLRIWDLERGGALRDFAIRQPVRALAVLPDSRRVLGGSAEGLLILWDLESGAELASWNGHAGGVLAVAVTPDGREAVSASQDKTLAVWNLESGDRRLLLEGHTEPVWSIALLPDGRRAISASADGTLKVWDLATGAALTTLEGHGSIGVGPQERGDVGGRSLGDHHQRLGAQSVPTSGTRQASLANRQARGRRRRPS